MTRSDERKKKTGEGGNLKKMMMKKIGAGLVDKRKSLPLTIIHANTRI